MGANHALKRSIQLCVKHNKEGSYATHSNRLNQLNQYADQLLQLGFRVPHVQNFKPKHIESLIEHWKHEKLSVGTIKNRMANLRWLASKIGKQNIIKRTNAEYGIENRRYVTNSINRAKKLKTDDLETIRDLFTRNSLRLQQAFGLRREESIKFQPEWADRGDRIILKDSWCKGGREREITILNLEQRALLDELKEFCKTQKCSAMIPADRNYYQQLKTYEYQTSRYKVDKNHGLRHEYAQTRYLEITGWESPKKGGMTSRKMTIEQRNQDFEARIQISQELGHNREDITAVYLGR